MASMSGFTEVPVVVKWIDAEQPNYIGRQNQNIRMSINLGTHTAPQLVFWFTLKVGVLASPKSVNIRTKSLYFVIQASLLAYKENDTCLSLETPNSDSSPDTSAAIRQAGIFTDHSSVSRICFQLPDHGTVFMPSFQTQPFTPASKNVSELLASIQSISRAKQFWVYTSLPGSLLASLWDKIDVIRKGTFAGDFTSQSVYKHGMVCDKWTNFNRFVKREDSANSRSIHGVKHNSDVSSLYTSESGESAGIQRKDSDRLHESGEPSRKVASPHDIDQQLVDTESDDELSVEQQRKRKYSKISSDSTPSGILKDAAGILNSNKSCTDHQSSRVQFAEPHFELPGSLERQLTVFINWVLEIDMHLEKECEQVFSDLGGAASRGDMARFNRIKRECMANIYITYSRRENRWVKRNTI